MSKPAFPRPYSNDNQEHGYFDDQQGMSLLEYFAGQALVGILTHDNAYENPSKAAAFAFEFAEAMVNHRKGSNNDK